jgi:ornithine carbamoyltransferase
MTPCRTSNARAITRLERAGDAARDSACRGVRRGEAPRNKNGAANMSRPRPAATSTWQPSQFLSVLDLTPAELETCLSLAATMKVARATGHQHAAPLAGRHVALLFDKPSLRTRSTFMIAVRELGGDVIEPPGDVALGGRETIEDVARNLERWVYGAVIRTFGQERLRRFAAAAPSLRVINALTDEEHPCQALADVQTLIERWGSVRGRTIAFVGDGNNVAASLAHAVAMLGGVVVVASPKGFELPDRVREEVSRVARAGGGVRVTNDPVEAVSGASAVYTDVWTSMGQENEAASRRGIFLPYQVNAALMAQALADALFMHCLPAHRGDEVTDDVLDSPSSVVFDQSENRLHVQKALLALLSAS